MKNTIYSEIIEYLYSTDLGKRMLAFGNSVCQDILIEIPVISNLYKKYGILKIYFENIELYDLYTNLDILEILTKIKFCRDIYIIEDNFYSSILKTELMYRLSQHHNVIFDIDLNSILFNEPMEIDFNSCRSFLSFINHNGAAKARSAYLIDNEIFNIKNKNMLQENIELLKLSILHFIMYDFNNRYCEKVINLTFSYYSGEEIVLENYKYLFEDINIYLLNNLSQKHLNYISSHKITVYIDKVYIDDNKNYISVGESQKGKLLTDVLFSEYWFI